MAPRRQPIEQRFWAKVRKTSTCWYWTGATLQGYGRFWGGEYSPLGNPRAVAAHRFAYELLVGPIPVGMDLDHECRTPACVRPGPGHCQPVTHRENIRRGIGTADQFQRAKTHCPQGHEYTPENTIAWAAPRRKHRICRICRRAYERGLRKRQRDALAAKP